MSEEPHWYRDHVLLLSRLKETTGPQGKPSGVETVLDRAESAAEPKRIGQFHVKRRIASGGMGTVYEAIQEHPRRSVAVKVMNPGVVSRSAMRRFELESEVLARLRHPGIAQIYETGTFDDGTGTAPFFAMEYIPDARSLTEYAREEQLSIRQRLELFAQVCEAVHHGHQKGVIHRDLKPGNILIDAEGHVKIIDFGVARGTDSDIALTTLQTSVGELIGTLQYMSPEQCAADSHDLDLRSDVYALGVVLYELLSERLPYDVSNKPVLERARMICQQPPTRLSADNPALKDDAETIVLKALEKDRQQRYETANDLSRDIKRYLNDEPVEARPPSTLYRFRKFARRNRTALTAAVIALVTVIMGLAISTVLIAKEQGRTADALTVAQANLRTAQEQRERASANFQRARDSVAHMLALLENMYVDFPTDPEYRRQLAMAYLQVANLCGETGQPDESEATFRRAIEMQESLVAEMPDRPDDRAQLAEMYWDLGVMLKNVAMEKTAALEAYRQSLMLREGLVAQFPDDPAYVDQLAWSHVDVGLVLTDLGRYDEGNDELRRSVSMRERLVRDFPESPEYRAALAHGDHWLGARLWASGQPEEAEKHLRRGIAIREDLIAEEPDTPKQRADLAHIEWYLADLLMETARHAEAERRWRNAILSYRELLAEAPGNRDYRHSIGDCSRLLGEGLMSIGRRHEAEQALRESLAMFEELVLDFPDMPELCEHLLYFLADSPDPRLRDKARALDLAHVCVDLNRHSARAWTYLGMAQYRNGQWHSAIDSVGRSLELSPRGYGTFERLLLAMAHWQAGDHAQALVYLDEAEALIDQEINERPAWGWRFRLNRLHAEAKDVLGLDDRR